MPFPREGQAEESMQRLRKGRGGGKGGWEGGREGET